MATATRFASTGVKDHLVFQIFVLLMRSGAFTPFWPRLHLSGLHVYIRATVLVHIFLYDPQPVLPLSTSLVFEDDERTVRVLVKSGGRSLYSANNKTLNNNRGRAGFPRYNQDTIRIHLH